MVAYLVEHIVYYGAKAAKLSRILGCSIEEAEVYIQNFWEGNKGVKMVIDYLTKFYKKHGYIVGLDGRKMMVRAEYKLLNTAIQGTAALIFKVWVNNANEELVKHPIYCKQIIEYHDEVQFRCHKDHVDIAMPIISQAANKVQQDLQLCVPIDCDCKVGMNWAETH